MKILITGGCGFLGSNIAAKALSDGHSVLIFDNLRRHGSTENLTWLREQGKFEFYHGDIRSFHDVHTAFSAFMPDHVFHLAGQVAMTTSIEQPRLDFEINALGTLNVLEVIRQKSPNTGIIYSSTNKVYGDLNYLNYKENESRYILPDLPNGIKADAPLDFHSPYGCSKGAADQYVLDYARIFKIKGIVFRHSSMYGGRQFATYDQGWVGWFCQQALLQSQGNNTQFTVSGNGKQVRDLLHADDMVSLYFKAADRLDSAHGQAYNIGGGFQNSLSVLELLHFLSSEVGKKLNYTHIASRESDQKIFVADISKAFETFDWAPEVGWKDGIRNMLEWTRSANI